MRPVVIGSGEANIALDDTISVSLALLGRIPFPHPFDGVR
jgi:hypothetical protein